MNAATVIRKADLTATIRTDGPGLLVSVRKTAEAAAALMGGADVIDVKEPSAGPLGAASIETIASVVDAVAGAAPVTVATGELGDRFPIEDLPTGVAIAKLGLAGSADRPWRAQTAEWASRLPVTTAGALVGYADWLAAEAPAPEAVLSHAIKVGCRGFVLDTWSKRGGCSLDLLDRELLKELICQATSHELLVVHAGSISLKRLEEAVSYGPTFVGVRGAACFGGRAGHVDADRVRLLAKGLGACRRGR